MPEKELPQDKIRVGVYTCRCGGNIGDVVRCEAVAKALAQLSNVVVSRTDMSMCSDAGQALIVEDIKDRSLVELTHAEPVETVDVRTIADEVAELLRPRFADTEIAIDAVGHGEWIVPAMRYKSDKDHFVPLTETAGR